MPVNDEVVDVLKQAKLLLLGFVVLVLLPVILYGSYIGRRIDVALAAHSPAQLEGEPNARSDLRPVEVGLSEGQLIYVPAYSHVYHGGGEPYQLTITLSIRNTSRTSEIVVDSVRYFDTKGKEVKSYLERPAKLPALGTTEVVVSSADTSGGSGANFLVAWHAKRPVSEPLVEAVMISTTSQQGISFARRGVVVQQALPEAPSVRTDRGGE